MPRVVQNHREASIRALSDKPVGAQSAGGVSVWHHFRHIAFKPPGQAVLNRLFQVPQKNSVPGFVWLKWNEKKIHGATRFVQI